MLSKSRLKYIQTLGQKKFRDSERLFLAEGPKLIKELLEEKNVSVREVLGLQQWVDAHHEQLKKTPVTTISEIELDRITQLSTANQVLAIVEQFPEESLKAGRNGLTILLDDIQDPGNLGTIIRLADWFGLKQIVCSEASADQYNPKVVQATMGSIGRVKLMYTDLMAWLDQQDDVPVYAAVLNGRPVNEIKRPATGILVVGNESKGIHPSILQRCSDRVTIPKKGKAESLNAAVATGILLSHLL